MLIYLTDADAECCNEETVVHCRVSPHRMPNLGVVMWHASSEHQSRFPIFSQLSMWLFPIVLPSFSPKISMCFPSINRKSPWVSHHILSWSQIAMCFCHPIHLQYKFPCFFPKKSPAVAHMFCSTGRPVTPCRDSPGDQDSSWRAVVKAGGGLTIGGDRRFRVTIADWRRPIKGPLFEADFLDLSGEIIPKWPNYSG